ncbi:MAG: serine/threonine-protein kinase, partial [Nannocystaceae bacterium]
MLDRQPPLPSAHADSDSRSLAPARAAIAQIARDHRDPHLQGIVLARLFGDQVQPQRVGRFVLLDRIGEGGMGVVYAAYDDQLDRKVAVKVLRTRPTTSEGHDRLLHEARALARLSHPNIVTVHEIGVHEGSVFVAMEHVRGLSLDRWMVAADSTDGGRPWEEVLRVFVDAGRGLAAAHRAGVVHRDFKPHNVILGDEGTVKVLDFGLARMVDTAPEASSETQPDGTPLTTRTQGVVGTPAYMAPEQHRGAAADARSDQFGYFASLYHALFGQLPFGRDGPDPALVATAEGHPRPPPPGASVPRWLHRVLQVGLSPDPALRFASMTAALEALTRDRAAQRRRVWSLVGSLVVIGSVAGLAAMTAGGPPPAPCEHGQLAMARAWGDQARASVARGIESSGIPLASETTTRVEPQLDAYAQRWAAARNDACIAHRDGDHSDTLHDRQVVCLDRRRVAFESLVELLASADRAAAERALTAAVTLPSVQDCARAESVLADIAPPRDPTVARRVETQRRALARAVEHEALGQYAPALALARGAMEQAERLEYRPLQAEAMVRLGSLTMEHGAPAEADAQLGQALQHALASAHFDVAAEAVARRIFVRAERMRTPERADDDVQLGAAVLEQVQALPRLRGLYLNNVGAYQIRRGDLDAAREVLLEALQTKRQGLGPDDPEIAYTLGNLSLVEQLTGHDRRAQAYLDEAATLVERVLGPHHANTAELARLQGELLYRTGHLRAARHTLQSVLDVLRETTGPRSALHHGPLVMLGEIALQQRRYDDALVSFEQAARLELPHEGGGTMYRVLEQVGRARARVGQ